MRGEEGNEGKTLWMQTWKVGRRISASPDPISIGYWIVKPALYKEIDIRIHTHTHTYIDIQACKRERSRHSTPNFSSYMTPGPRFPPSSIFLSLSLFPVSCSSLVSVLGRGRSQGRIRIIFSPVKMCHLVDPHWHLNIRRQPRTDIAGFTAILFSPKLLSPISLFLAPSKSDNNIVL